MRQIGARTTFASLFKSVDRQWPSGMACSQQGGQGCSQCRFGLRELVGKADQLSGLGARGAQPTSQCLVSELVAFSCPHPEGVDDAAGGVVQADAGGRVQCQLSSAEVKGGWLEVMPLGLVAVGGRGALPRGRAMSGQRGWRRRARGEPVRWPGTALPGVP